jgi:hypothetical protein
VPSCFLSYSEAYRPVMERVRSLLKALDFDVQVFDEPSLRPPSEAVRSVVQTVDCVVAILGPDFRTPNDERTPAEWPRDEAVTALAMQRPLALIVHHGTELPKALQYAQSPSTFDFRSDTSYAENAHKVLRLLLDLKRLLELPPGAQPFYYTRVSISYTIQGDVAPVVQDVRHDVVARQSCATFHHAIDMGAYAGSDLHLELLNLKELEVRPTQRDSTHTFSIELLTATDLSQPYLVRVDPPLSPGEQSGYRRRFKFANYFPLTRAALSRLAESADFPAIFRQDEKTYFGQWFDVVYELEAIAVTYRFAADLRISSDVQIVAAVTNTKEENEGETARVKAADCLTVGEDEETGDTLVRMDLRNPVIGHSYALLYRPSE